MAGLCEGGNEPPGSLKASNKADNACDDVESSKFIILIDKRAGFEFEESSMSSYPRLGLRGGGGERRGDTNSLLKLKYQRYELENFNDEKYCVSTRELQNRAYNRLSFELSESIRQGRASDRMFEFQPVAPDVLQARQNTDIF
ncbi:hypothetical protein ANN_04795 [Periplaneta americana]|uniref:Uncharacterized protein n=1 Tax=Periplaneta americana TaxID=6978 RepID=A0ABQ8TBU1_PERAM|nr:hypothetical protein ANN_04795 [Periplaneta americana]